MAQVVHGGSREFNMLMSGEQHPNTVQYLRGQMESLGTYTGGASTVWSQRVQESFERFSSDTAIRQAQAAIRKISTHFQSDRVYVCDSLAEIQNAQLRMQRFIMACPEVRQMHHAQRIDGYNGTYVDMWPTEIGPGHYDYDLVMDGVVVDIPATKEDPEDSWSYTYSFDDVLEGDRKLSIVEKDAILTTWDRVRDLMGTGLDDPTSPTGGML